MAHRRCRGHRAAHADESDRSLRGLLGRIEQTPGRVDLQRLIDVPVENLRAGREPGVPGDMQRVAATGEGCGDETLAGSSAL